MGQENRKYEYKIKIISREKKGFLYVVKNTDFHLKNLFQSHVESDLDVNICYRATANLAKLLVRNF